MSKTRTAYHCSVSASLIQSNLHANDSQHPPRHEVYQNNEIKVHRSIKPCSVSTIQRGGCSSEPMTLGCHSYRIARKRRTMVVPSGIEIIDVPTCLLVPFSTLSLPCICPGPPNTSNGRSITFPLLLATPTQLGAKLQCMIPRQALSLYCSSALFDTPDLAFVLLIIVHDCLYRYRRNILCVAMSTHMLPLFLCKSKYRQLVVDANSFRTNQAAVLQTCAFKYAHRNCVCMQIPTVSNNTPAEAGHGGSTTSSTPHILPASSIFGPPRKTHRHRDIDHHYDHLSHLIHASIIDPSLYTPFPEKQQTQRHGCALVLFEPSVLGRQSACSSQP